MASSTVEDYIKQIFLTQQESGRRLVPMGRLAAAVGVTPGTATTMIKTLAEAGLVAYAPRGGARLTRKGERLALHVVRRHRLVELFLVKVLGLDWSEVHHEAEELEHAVSDRLLERIADFLDHPLLDPHGDPIPTADGTIERLRLMPLTECGEGETYRIARVADQDPRFLRFVESQGLKPGARVEVVRRDEWADAMTVRLRSGATITLGATAAAKIFVKRAE